MLGHQREGTGRFLPKPPRISHPSKPAALRDSLPGHNRWRQLKPKYTGLDHSSYEIWVFDCQHSPLPTGRPHKLVVAFRTREGHRYSKAVLVEVRDLLQSISLPCRALQRAQSRERLLQSPFHKCTLLKTHSVAKQLQTAYTGAAAGPRCLL